MTYQTTNDFDLTRQDGTYTGAPGELVVSDGGTITLPTPTAGEKFGVRALRNDVTLLPNGSIEASTGDRRIDSEGNSVFVSDGTEWYLVSGNEYFGFDIPDDQVYLHEDWGNNKYENRDSTTTFSYNGVQGVYRPEWTIQTGSASVSNEQLSFDTDPTVLSTDINLDLSQTVRWVWRIDTGGSGRLSGGCFAETNNESTGGGFPALYDGYHIMCREGQPDVTLVREDSDGNTTNVARDTSGSISNGYIGAERTSTGDWTLYGTEDSLSDPKTDLFSSIYELATGSDSTYTNANYISVGQNSSTGGIIREGKSF